MSIIQFTIVHSPRIHLNCFLWQSSSGLGSLVKALFWGVQNKEKNRRKLNLKEEMLNQYASPYSCWWLNKHCQWQRTYKNCLLTFIIFIISILQVRMRLKFWQKVMFNFNLLRSRMFMGLGRSAFWSKTDPVPVLFGWPWRKYLWFCLVALYTANSSLFGNHTFPDHDANHGVPSRMV